MPKPNTEHALQNAEIAALELLSHSTNMRAMATNPLAREYHAEKYAEEIATIERNLWAVDVVFCQILADAIFETTAAIRNGRKV